jgi:hypothetical protein
LFKNVIYLITNPKPDCEHAKTESEAAVNVSWVTPVPATVRKEATVA